MKLADIAAPSKSEIDALKRENAELTQIISDLLADLASVTDLASQSRRKAYEAYSAAASTSPDA